MTATISLNTFGNYGPASGDLKPFGTKTQDVIDRANWAIGNAGGHHTGSDFTKADLDLAIKGLQLAKGSDSGTQKDTDQAQITSLTNFEQFSFQA